MLAVRPGRRNAITDVAGLQVGQAQDRRLATGVTVVLANEPAMAAVDVRGGAPGTRETDLLRPGCLVERVDAVVLSGGSAFGLDAASGVTAWLRQAGRGYRVGEQRVPIVPAAILYDLGRGGSWSEPPWAALGRAAAEALDEDVALGTVGAGTGAMAGGIKGGTGTASVVAEGVTIGALAVANPRGAVVMPGRRRFWAWWLEQEGEFGGMGPPDGPPEPAPALPSGGPANTTLAVIATDAALDRAALGRVAVMAHDGFARAIRPVHTPFDGDVVFALSTGSGPPLTEPETVARIGAHAADCVARAITRGVYEAESLADMIAWRDLA